MVSWLFCLCSSAIPIINFIGLFLYVRLVIEDIASQPTAQKAFEAAENLPRGLEEL